MVLFIDSAIWREKNPRIDFYLEFQKAYDRMLAQKEREKAENSGWLKRAQGEKVLTVDELMDRDQRKLAQQRRLVEQINTSKLGLWKTKSRPGSVNSDSDQSTDLSPPLLGFRIPVQRHSTSNWVQQLPSQPSFRPVYSQNCQFPSLARPLFDGQQCSYFVPSESYYNQRQPIYYNKPRVGFY